MKTIQILAAIMLVVFLVGCNSSPTEIKETPEDEKNVQESEIKTTEPAKTAEQEKGLKDILSGAKMKYKAEYEMTAEGETQTMTMAYDLPKFSYSAKADGVETKSFYDGESFVVCTKEDEWQCIKMQIEMPSNMQTEESIKEGESIPKATGTCTVAGEKGNKYEVSAEGITSSVCYTNDGILLEMISQDMKMIAKSVSRNVLASEFVPPAEPQDLTEMMKNIPGMGETEEP
jgi:hypothetical protein